MAYTRHDYTYVLNAFRQYIPGVHKFPMFTRRIWTVRKKQHPYDSSMRVLFINDNTIYCGRYCPDNDGVHTIQDIHPYHFTAEDLHALDFVRVKWWVFYNEPPKFGKLGEMPTDSSTKNTVGTDASNKDNEPRFRLRSLFTESDNDFIPLANAYRKLLIGDAKHNDQIEKWYDATKKYIIESTKLNSEWRKSMGLDISIVNDGSTPFKTQLIYQHIEYVNAMKLISEANKHVHE